MTRRKARSRPLTRRSSTRTTAARTIRPRSPPWTGAGQGILRKWLKSGYVERKTFHAAEEGAPQGGIMISLVLCI
jgi:hypothetical protein